MTNEERARKTGEKINSQNNEWANDLQQGIVKPQKECDEWSAKQVLSALNEAVRDVEAERDKAIEIIARTQKILAGPE